jgi:hypothetical protein
MDVEVRQRLEDLRERTKAESLTEVIRRALAVYETLWRSREEGQSVWIGERGDESKRELLLL